MTYSMMSVMTPNCLVMSWEINDEVGEHKFSDNDDKKFWANGKTG